jgi:hypothetical protein
MTTLSNVAVMDAFGGLQYEDAITDRCWKRDRAAAPAASSFAWVAVFSLDILVSAASGFCESKGFSLRRE